MKSFIAFRTIPSTELYEAVTRVRHHGKWYPVLGYDPTDGIMCLDNFTGDDITIDARTLHHSDVRVEVDVKSFTEVLDIFS